MKQDVQPLSSSPSLGSCKHGRRIGRRVALQRSTDSDAWCCTQASWRPRAVGATCPETSPTMRDEDEGSTTISRSVSFTLPRALAHAPTHSLTHSFTPSLTYPNSSFLAAPCAASAVAASGSPTAARREGGSWHQQTASVFCSRWLVMFQVQVHDRYVCTLTCLAFAPIASHALILLSVRISPFRKGMSHGPRTGAAEHAWRNQRLPMWIGGHLGTLDSFSNRRPRR